MIVKLNKKYTLEINIFKCFSYSYGIQIINFDMSICYKGDHTPSFNFYFNLLNIKLLEIEICTGTHEDDE